MCDCAIKGFITFGNYYFSLVVVGWMQIALLRVLCIVSLYHNRIYIYPRLSLRHINANNDSRPIRNYLNKRDSMLWIKSATATMNPTLSPSYPFRNLRKTWSFMYFCRSLAIIGLSFYLFSILSSPTESIPREILNSALPLLPNEKAEKRKRGEIVSQEQRRHRQNEGTSSVSLPAYW